MPKKSPEQVFVALYRMANDPAASEEEREKAKREMPRRLKRMGRTERDYPEIFAKAAADDQAQAPPPPPSDPRDTEPVEPIGGGGVSLAGLIRALLREYAAMSEHQYVATTLWVLHTHVYDRFEHTSRLVLTSPVKGCGKTTVIKVLNRLVARAEVFDNITAAGIYDETDKGSTLLLDEADNLDLASEAALRAVLNSGWSRGGRIKRGKGKQAQIYSTFAPIVLAAIRLLTAPLMERSIVIHMVKHDRLRKLRRFIKGHTPNLDAAYQYAHKWAIDPRLELDLDPGMPAELPDRAADNWRPLVSIADAIGGEWPALARAAAIALTEGYSDDIITILLRDTREVFDALGADRMATEDIVKALHALEEAGWDAWRGEDGDLRPHKITPAELSHLMRARFRVKSRSIWPPGPRRPEHKSRKGFWRVDLEPLWVAYCGGAGTAARPALRVIGKSEE